MAVTLSVGTNSYITVTDATTYFNERLYADAWTNAVADDKSKALIMASKKIDRQPIRGRKAAVSQAMEFPRMIYSYERNNTNINTKHFNYGPGWYIQDAVPQNVLEATCEEALAILQYGTSKRIMLQKQGVKGFNIGGMSETFSGVEIKFLSQEAKELLSEFIGGGAVIS